MIATRSISQVASRRDYNRIFNANPLGTFEPVGTIASRIPKYADPLEQAPRFGRLGTIAFGVAEVFFGLLVLLCVVGLISAGLFLKGK